MTIILWNEFTYTLRAIKCCFPYSSYSICKLGRTQCQQLYKFYPCCILLALTKKQLSRAFPNSMDFQISFTDYYRRIRNSYAAGKLQDFFYKIEFVITKIVKSSPISQADVHFIDSSL